MNFVFLLLLAITFLANQAQSQQIGAKIFRKDQQVIHAIVRLQSKESTPQSFQYSSEGKAPYQEIQASQIKRIEFEDGQVLESYFISIPVIIQPYINRSAADYHFKKNIFTSEVLLEKIVGGKISLYQFVDKHEFPHFFFSYGSDSVVHLRYNTYTSANLKFHEDQLYKNLIAELATSAGCQALKVTDFEKLEYDLKSLKKMVERINTCIGNAPTTYASISEKQMNVHGGILVGATSTSIGMDYAILSRSNNVVAGFYFNIVPVKKGQKNFYGIDFAYSSFKGEGKSISANPGIRYLSAQIFTASPMIKRFFSSKAVGFYGMAGVSFGATLKAEEEFNGLKTDYRKGFWGVLGGVGFGSQRLSMELVSSVMPFQARSNYIRLQGKISVF